MKKSNLHRHHARVSDEEGKSAQDRDEGKAAQGGSKASRPAIPVWRLWLYRGLVATVFPALLIVAVDYSLRFAGYGFNPDTAVLSKVQGVPSYISNDKFSWRFFPPRIARTPEHYVFSKDKSDDTFRIFVMGASAAAGEPESAFAFGRILQVMLSQTHPQVKFEVITTAMPAINSHVALTIAQDCRRYDPDLFVVYLGNNEVLGPYGAGTVFQPLIGNRSLIRSSIAVKGTRLGQLLTSGSRAVGPKTWGSLAMFLEHQVRADEPGLLTVYKHFEDNLRDIGDQAIRAGIPAMFCTVATDLRDTPPFASLHRVGMTEQEVSQFDELYGKGVEHEENAQYSKALEFYAEAARIDETYADLRFRIGRCQWLSDNFDLALENYRAAREYDTLRFRADARINEAIRKVADKRTEEGIHLVDVEDVFARQSPHGAPGKELFLEHVHMKFRGNYLLAKAVFDSTTPLLVERGIAAKRVPPDEGECARRLAYTLWEEQKIVHNILYQQIKRPPFTNQLYYQQRLKRFEDDLKRLNDELTSVGMEEMEPSYRWAIEQAPTDHVLNYRYALFLQQWGQYEAAAKQCQVVVDAVPHHADAFNNLGIFNEKKGNLYAAVSYFRKAVAIAPLHSTASYNLGAALQLQNKLEQAVEVYQVAIHADPRRAETYINLGLALRGLDRPDEALATFREGLTFRPKNLWLHQQMGLLYLEIGQTKEAITAFQAALAIDPDFAPAREGLRKALKVPLSWDGAK